MIAADSQGKVPAMRVLVAEDETLIRLDLVETLTDSGLVVVDAVANGQAAVDSALATRPDVVLMDISMPVRDGISAAEQIISSGTAPVVMLTAFTDVGLLDRAASAGVFGYLVKPLRVAELIPALVVARNRWQQFNELNTEISRLRERAHSNDITVKAKQVLMDQGLSEERAFALLRRWAMDRRQTIAEIATHVVASGNMPSE